MIIAGRKTAQFFGVPSRQLFGVLHEALGDVVRDTGIVLCYPAPQEYRMVHWGYHNLATMLAEHGFPVLRFDYYATGDSSGDSRDGTLDGWQDDVVSAVEHLRGAAGVRRIALVGKRLGAVLALRATASGVTARDVVLWDPVIRGAPYLQQLDVAQRWVLEQQPYPIPSGPIADELFGYPFPDAMRGAVQSIDMLTEAFGQLRRMHVVAPAPSALHRDFVDRANALGVTTTYEVVTDPVPYQNEVEPADTLVTHGAARSILSFLMSKS